MSTTAEQQQRPPTADPLVEPHSERTWRRWLYSLGREDPERVLGFGVVVGLGFVLGIVAMWLFLRLADEVLEQNTVALDASATALVLQLKSAPMDTVMQALSMLGNELIWVLAPLAVLLFLWQRRWGAAVLLVLVTVGAQVLNDVLKAEFHRARPMPLSGFIDAQQYSFPSGHAMMAAAFYSFLAYMFWRQASGRWRWIVPVVLALLLILVGISRIYLEAHYLTDVLAGFAAGFLWTDVIVVGSRVLTARRGRTLRT
jgi:membrane-associated phospholipid phosphatase